MNRETVDTDNIYIELAKTELGEEIGISGQKTFKIGSFLHIILYHGTFQTGTRLLDGVTKIDTCIQKTHTQGLTHFE